MKYKDYLRDHGLPVCFGIVFLLLLLGFGGLTGVPVYFIVTVGVGSAFLGAFVFFWEDG